MFLWDINEPLVAVNDPKAMTEYVKKPNQILPVSQYEHKTEGFALDWSNIVHGQLATGDCKGNIHLWKLDSNCTWSIDQKPFIGHEGSIEGKRNKK